MRRTGKTRRQPSSRFPPEPGETAEPTPPADEYEAALQEARQALLDREAALQRGDWAAFGEADDRLTEAVEKLIELGG